MLKLSLFASRQFRAINVATVLLYGALAAAGYLLVLHCELTLGWSATAAGSVLIPSSAVFLALSPVSGVVERRAGPRVLMTAGIVAVALAFLWLAFARGGYAGAILPAVLLWGAGLGLTVTPLTAAVLAAVAAVISAVFVTGARRVTTTAPAAFAPPAPFHGCALPVADTPVHVTEAVS
jgi:Na+/melibiose symporter-like transporter